MTGSDTRGEELIGKTLGSYFVEHRLGAGATGVVFRVRREGETAPLALKVLHENLGSIGSLKRRFEREARVLAKLEHPNVVRITDFGVVGGSTYIAMELLEGVTLEELLDSAPLDPERGIRIVSEVLKGLAFAHERSVVHRDLKPANVFLCKDPGGGEEHVKLLDFGLAKILSDDEAVEGSTLTRRGRIVGTPAYMAPEQITGVSLDVRADVYSAGILLYELLADRRPFLFDRRSELLRAHLLEPVPPLVVARPELRVHPELDGIVQRALEKNPADRFPDARAMLDAIEALPPHPVSLASPSASPGRARAGATSEVITSGERRAVSTSVSTGDPIGASVAPRALAAPSDVLTSAIPGAPLHRPSPPSAGAAPDAHGVSPRLSGVDATMRTRPTATKPPTVSTGMLYVLATSLFGIAGLLWWALGPR